MTTPILELDEWIENQNQPHVPVNDAVRALETAATRFVVIDKADPVGSPSGVEGDVYVVPYNTALPEWIGHENAIAYYSGGWKFLTPQLGWRAHLQYDGSELEYTDASPDPWQSAGVGPVDATEVSYDGSLTVAQELDTLRTETAKITLSVGIPVSIPGKPTAGAVFHILMPFAVRLPASLTGSAGFSGTNATANSDFVITKNGGASLGYVRFANGSSSASFSFASAVDFAAGDRLTITAPSPQDATLADVGFTLLATRL